jgi:histone deacetylase complex regulatory component SIN3
MGDIFANDTDLLEKFQAFLPQNQKKAETQDPAADLDAEEVD